MRLGTEAKALRSPARERARYDPEPVRALADQMFSRAAGAPLLDGNHVRLLQDATENYPAWLEAIESARHHVHFETYILHDDEIGERFAEAFAARVRAGVCVRLVYDWLGALGKTSPRFWKRLRAAGVEVRCYNPPHPSSPLGWLSRDHRKLLTVDGRVGFVTGLCVGRMWAGRPERDVEPWRDTGVEIRGPAVAEIERAFAQMWAALGEPLPGEEPDPEALAPAGEVRVRIVASLPATASLFRLDQLVVALARRRVWLTDAYFAGATTYVQGLIAAAQDGVDVRLLVPDATDVPLMKPLSRVGYRALLAAGVRVFEWKGSMLHAKTAVVDGRWSRVGSTNLNLASWLGNWELDAVIEDEPFAAEMEAVYLRDLTNATEIVLDARSRVRPSAAGAAHPRRRAWGGRGSAGRAAAGAIRIGNAVGAAFTDRRVLEPVEARMALTAGLVLGVLALVLAFFPRLLAVPMALVTGWLGLALLYRGFTLHRRSKGRDQRADPDVTSRAASRRRAKPEQGS